MPKVMELPIHFEIKQLEKVEESFILVLLVYLWQICTEVNW